MGWFVQRTVVYVKPKPNPPSCGVVLVMLTILAIGIAMGANAGGVGGAVLGGIAALFVAGLLFANE